MEMKKRKKMTNKASFFEDRTIMIFGGTGTIGSLIVEHLKTDTLTLYA